MGRRVAAVIGSAAVVALLPAPQGCSDNGGEASGPSDCIAARDGRLIQLSSYDQSCKVDSDCVAVGVGNSCLPCDIDCSNAAINKTSLAQYKVDIANSPTLPFPPCGCASGPALFSLVCCVTGTCSLCSAQSFGAATDAAADASASDGADAAGE